MKNKIKLEIKKKKTKLEIKKKTKLKNKKINYETK